MRMQTKRMKRIVAANNNIQGTFCVRSPRSLPMEVFSLAIGLNAFVGQKESDQKENDRRHAVNQQRHMPAFLGIGAVMPEIPGHRQGRVGNDKTAHISTDEFKGRGARSFRPGPADDPQHGRVGNVDGRIHEHEKDEGDIGINHFRRSAKSRRRKGQNRRNRQRNRHPQQIRPKLAPPAFGAVQRVCMPMTTSKKASNNRETPIMIPAAAAAHAEHIGIKETADTT